MQHYLVFLTPIDHVEIRTGSLPMGRPWVTPNPSIHPFFAFFVAFNIFVLGERRDFKFGTQVDCS